MEVTGTDLGIEFIWSCLLQQGSQGRWALKCEELLLWVGENARHGWAAQEKVVLTVHTVLSLCSNKNSILGRKKPQCHSMPNKLNSTLYLGCCQFVVAVGFFFLVEDEVVESVTAQISLSTTTQVLAAGWMPVLNNWRSLHLWARNLMPRASEYRGPCMVIFWWELTGSAEARGEEMWGNQGTMADNYAGFIS